MDLIHGNPRNPHRRTIYIQPLRPDHYHGLMDTSLTSVSNRTIPGRLVALLRFISRQKQGLTALDDTPDYMAMAEQAEKAALRASGRVAKRFLLFMVEEYRRRAAEALKLEKPFGHTRGNSDAAK